ncbi:MAG: hypothetical protein DBY28_02260 [Subdoligranulum sp.]|nr:MAG: hypothetical protein DBY28_02260 [Subdoligranulum sp.]
MYQFIEKKAAVCYYMKRRISWMTNFFVSTDSTCDLYANEIEKMGIGYLPLTITIEENGETRFMQDKFQTYDEYVNFFEMLKNPALNIFTSKNNTEIHREYFEKLAEAGHRNIIHFTISYQLANTRDNTVQAAEMVKEKYPDFNLVPIESHTTTVCQGMLVKMAVKLRDEGKTLQEAVDFVEDKKHKIQHFVVVDDLYHLKRGGRIGGTAAAIGTLIKIKIMLDFDREGKLRVIQKISGGKKRALKYILSNIKKFTFADDAYPTVVHTGDLDGAKIFAEEIKKQYGIEPEIRIMGPTIGCHVGPGAVAFTFVSNELRP